MAKTCIEPGCNRDQFGGQYCAYHQFRRHMRGGDKYKQNKENKKQKSIPRRSKKRAKDEKYYAVEAKEKYEELKAQKQNTCFFCGEEVKTFQGFHHLRKRYGNKLRDWEYIVLAHNDCHNDYHYLCYERLIETWWYNGFLERLKSKDELTYRKELKKQEKAQSEIEFDDEEENTNNNIYGLST